MDLKLSEYRPVHQLVTPWHAVNVPRFPVIDVHTHMYTPAWLELLKAKGGAYNTQRRPDDRQRWQRWRRRARITHDVSHGDTHPHANDR